jgi:AcrR family transcriptional regulator
MPRSTDAREKALLTAERLFRIQGYTATGLTQILEESGAPKGSFYFHFPGGKEQMAREVLHAYGARAEAAIRTLARRHDGEPGAFVLALCRALAHELEASGWAMGCAAQNLANELAPANRQMPTRSDRPVRRARLRRARRRHWWPLSRARGRLPVSRAPQLPSTPSPSSSNSRQKPTDDEAQDHWHRHRTDGDGTARGAISLDSALATFPCRPSRPTTARPWSR